MDETMNKSQLQGRSTRFFNYVQGGDITPSYERQVKKKKTEYVDTRNRIDS